MPLPATTTAPNGKASESYGVNFKSELIFDFYFEFLSAHRLHYKFYIVLADLTPFAAMIEWDRPLFSRFGYTAVTPSATFKYWSDLAIGLITTAVY